MEWTILALNTLTIIISIKKRVLPYAIFTMFFVFLVVGQAFQISSDMDGAVDVTYRYAYISRDGFNAALWYVFGISAISLLLVSVARGYRKGSQPPVTRTFDPPQYLYFALLTYLIVVSSILIFVVVGLSEFINSSRPGYQTGATILIVLLAVGIFPLLLKFIHRNKVNKLDIACFATSLTVTGGFSRIHVILYLTILIITGYYARPWADSTIKLRAILLASATAAIATLLFFAVGAIRDAENYTGGSFNGIKDYLLEHPDQSLTTVSANYRISIEGMSGLAGAFTLYLSRPASVKYDFGSYWTFKGALQWIPGFMKPSVNRLNDELDGLRWYTDSIIAPGIESSFESFGWFGMPFYALAFFVLAWEIPLFIVTHRISAMLKLAAFILIGCCMFFVRGSFVVWIGYSISYVGIIAISWPMWCMWVKPLNAVKRRAT